MKPAFTYMVFSNRFWTEELKKQFGENRSIHTLTDQEVVAAIIEHGRAEITIVNYGLRGLDFQNDYD